MSIASPRAAALALLTDHSAGVSRKSGQFLGQVAVQKTPLSEPQSKWLADLMEQAGLPPQSDSEWGGQAP